MHARRKGRAAIAMLACDACIYGIIVKRLGRERVVGKKGP
jgi:hypothetical protein